MNGFDGDNDTAFDDEFDKVPVSRASGNNGNLMKLPDGEHFFTVLDGERKAVGKMILYTLKVGVTTGMGTPDQIDYTGEKVYYLVSKDGKVDERNVNNLKADLAVLGFDVDKWMKALGRPFMAELDKVKPILAGLRFKGKKSVSPNKNDAAKPYLNVYVNERDATDGKPAVIDEKVISEHVTEEVPF